VPHDAPRHSRLKTTTALPTQPGWYWWLCESQSREILVHVCLKKGKLTVWWPNRDTPIEKLKGSWRGPIPPSTGPGDPTAS